MSRLGESLTFSLSDRPNSPPSLSESTNEGSLPDPILRDRPRIPSQLSISSDEAEEGPSSAPSNLVTPPRRPFAIISGDADPTRAALERQEVALPRRRMSLGQTGRRMRRRISVSGAGPSVTLSTVKGRWRHCLSSLPEDFFSCSEALLERRASSGKGSVLCGGLSIAESSNEDLQGSHEATWKARHDCGQTTGSYDQFRSAIGQFCRMAASLGKKDSDLARDLYKKGHLLELSADMQVVKAYIGLFRLNGQASTVRAKAAHLKKLADCAQAHFCGPNQAQLRGMAISISECLRGVSPMQKYEARRQRRARKSEEERALRSEILTASDFARRSKTAKDSLGSIIHSHGRERRESGARGASRLLRAEKGIASKWSINFIALLALEGCGQRLQAYSQLQLPSATELRDMEAIAISSGVFELRAIVEKTPRALDMPNAVFPAKLFRHAKLHVSIPREKIFP